MNFSISPSSTESEPYLWPPSSLWGLSAENLRDIPSLRSWSSPSSPSLLGSRRRGLWAWLRWGVFAVLGLGLGLSGEVADHLAMHGQFSLAAVVFPWNRYIRTRPGYEVGMHGGDITVVERALNGDPYSADLTYGLGAMFHMTDHEAESQLMAKRFLAIAPRSPLIQGAAK